MAGGRGRPGRPFKIENNVEGLLECPVCGIRGKQGTEFSYGGRQGKPCKPCANARLREWHATNPKSKEWRRERYEKNREFVRAYKLLHGCASCGEDDPVCLDFHHRDPDQKKWSIALRMGAKRETLIAEMEKCIVICRNCHAKLHWGR